jgi:hypothetical protein
MEKIYVTVDNERIEATGELLEEVMTNQLEAKELAEKRINDEKIKAQAKAALLDRLGITADEAKLLLA